MIKPQMPLGLIVPARLDCLRISGGFFLCLRAVAVRCVVLVWAPRCVCLPVPPPFPWGREPALRTLEPPEVSSRGILGVRRTGLRCIVLVWAPRCVYLPIPPPFPWGRGLIAAHLGALGGFSSRGILGVRRTGLRCIVLVWAPRGVYLPIPPPFPWGRGLVAALRCGHRWVLLPGFLLPCVSGLWCRPSRRWADGLRAGPCVGSRLSVPARPVSVTP